MEVSRKNILISTSYSGPDESLIAGLLSYYGYGVGPDQFDAKSTFVIARLDGEPVGMLRLTRGSGPLQDWCLDGTNLPVGEEVIQLTRGVVLPEFRRRGVLRTMISAALDHVGRSGARLAVAAVEPTAPHLLSLLEAGFEPLPGVSLYAYAPQRTAYLTTMIYTVRKEARRPMHL